MPLASEVAAELRKLADSLDREPNADIQKAWVSFHCYTKDRFTATAKLLPRPLKKREQEGGMEAYRRIYVEYISDALDVNTSAYKNLTCTLIEPAKPAVYRCEPILSLEDEAEVSA